MKLIINAQKTISEKYSLQKLVENELGDIESLIT